MVEGKQRGANPSRYSDLVVDVLDMVTYRFGRKHENFRHLAVGEALHHESEDLDFALSELRGPRPLARKRRLPRGLQNGVYNVTIELARSDLPVKRLGGLLDR